VESDRVDVNCWPLRSRFLFACDVSDPAAPAWRETSRRCRPPQAAFDDEVPQIMRHEPIVSRRRAHFDDSTALQGGAHGVAPLAGAKKSDGHLSATGVVHRGTAAWGVPGCFRTQ
jgi:hypothetical protein